MYKFKFKRVREQVHKLDFCLIFLVVFETNNIASLQLAIITF